MSADVLSVKAPDVVGKWGRRIAERGFAQIPNYLININQFLDEDHALSPIDLLILVQLVAAWWEKDKMPFPSLALMARRAGVSERQAQRAVTKLEKQNFLKRKKERRDGLIAPNSYDLSPLVALLARIDTAFPNSYPRKIPEGLSAKLLSRDQNMPASSIKDITF